MKRSVIQCGRSQIRQSAPRLATFARLLGFYNITQVVRIRKKPSFEEKTRFIMLGLLTSNLRYLKKEWCIYVIENAVRSEPQEHNRYRFWAAIPEIGNRYLRVITLDDKITIHNAFPDRGFKP